ncbi:hypothetical protein [Nesterenkonia sp.]|uniref:maltokinase N-terminal cap-like domain-containing protein n=1 Tax=Nesterenkonia sp. TaxID=704201 RepID=UPI002610661A|nr:hypothetical protein [Nesterenkonia sp.]
MKRIRGEEQPGFLEILGNWLPHQPWFPELKGRHRYTRVGGLRLPAPQGEADAGLVLELHIFEVTVPGADPGQEPERISVPLALRSRPSALAGKSAFIGKLSTTDGEDLWVYDGARDRAFLTAWLEMARRRQGSRNGRSRGEAMAGFADWEPFELKLRRRMVASSLPNVTRTLVAPENTAEDGDWDRKVAVDLLRRPAEEHPQLLETVLTLTAAHSQSISRVLGTVTGAWEDREYSSHEALEWQSGLLGVIREAGAEAPSAHGLAKTALQEGSGFTQTAYELGKTLGNFHADMAGSFGAHPQSTEQLRSMSAAAQRALSSQWERVRSEFDEDESADLNDVIDLMTMQLRDADEPLMLQTIHGEVSLHHFHRMTDQRWIVSESGGMVEHTLGLRDVVTVLISLANTVMSVASQTPEINTEAESEAGAPVNFGLWYEQASVQLLAGYRDSDADSTGVDSVFFRAAMLAEALELFHQWEGRWVFRPSMLLQADS